MAYYQQNMLSIKSRRMVANILAEVVLLSESIESYREALADVPYFDCIALFRFLDREEKGFLREKDFENVIGTSHRKLVTYSFSWLDNLKVGEISRLEFAAFLLPRDNLQLRELVAQRMETPEISYSQNQTILSQFNIFRQLLLEIIKSQMKLIELRRQLISYSDYSIAGVLLAIDQHSHDWVCTEDIFNFMKNYGFDCNFRQIQKLVQTINYHLNGRVNAKQLQWTVEGFQTKNKTYLNKIKYANKKVINKKINFDEPINKEKEQKLLKIKTSNKENKNNETSKINKEYNLIKQKLDLAEKESQEIDKKLQQYEQKSLYDTETIYKQQLSNRKLKHELDLLKQKAELQNLSKQQNIRFEIQNLIAKNSSIQRETDRVYLLESQYFNRSEQERLLQEIKLKYRNNVKKQLLLNGQPKKYTGIQTNKQEDKRKESSQQRNRNHFEAQNLINHHRYLTPNRYKYVDDDQGTNRLNKIQEEPNQLKRDQNKKLSSVVAINQRKQHQIQQHLSNSQVYLNKAKQLREIIKAERQIEKSIHQKFHPSRGIYQILTKNTSEVNQKNQQFSENIKNGIHYSRGNNQHENEQQTRKVRASSKKQEQIYESPSRRGGSTYKPIHTVSTGNKMYN